MREFILSMLHMLAFLFLASYLFVWIILIFGGCPDKWSRRFDAIIWLGYCS